MLPAAPIRAMLFVEAAAQQDSGKVPGDRSIQETGGSLIKLRGDSRRAEKPAGDRHDVGCPGQPKCGMLYPREWC